MVRFHKNSVMRLLPVVAVMILGIMLFTVSISWSAKPDVPAWAVGVKKLLHFNFGSTLTDPAIIEIAHMFESEYGVKIDFEAVPEQEVISRSRRSLALKGSTYDTFEMWPAVTIPSWTKNGWIQSFDDHVSNRDISKWFPVLWSAGEYEGKHYLIPYFGGGEMTLVTRKDMANAAGFGEAPKDWADILALAQKVKVMEPDKWGVIYGAGIAKECYVAWATWLGAAGIRVWNDDGSPNFDNPAAIDALTFLVDLIQKYKVTPESVTTWKSGTATDGFVNGASVMSVTGTGHQLKKAVDSFGRENIWITTLPPKTKDTKAIYPVGFGGGGIAASVYSKNPDAAREWALYQGKYISAWLELVVEGNVAFNKDVYTSPYALQACLYTEPLLDYFENGYRFRRDRNGEITELVPKYINAALSGQKTPDQAVKDFVLKLKEKGLL